MPNLFLKIDQTVSLDAGPAFVKERVQSMIENSDMSFDINCTFILIGSDSSCGFSIKASDFIEGGFSISAIDSKSFSIAISGLAKVKVYEMQMTAYSEKRPLSISSVSIAGSAAGMDPIVSNLSPDTVVQNFDNTHLLLRSKIGIKKSALLDYQ